MAMKRKNLPELVPQVFEHEQFGKIRFIQQNGELWFVAADVCCALDLENVTKALYPLADDEKNTFTISKGIVGNPKMRFINESGLYRLIFASRKPEAEKFRRWVFHEVLPSIRKYGYYNMAAEKKMVIYSCKPAPELLEPMTEEEFFDVIGKLAEAERIEIRQG